MAVDRILERLDSLIDMGATVLRAPVGEMGYYVDTGLFQQYMSIFLLIEKNQISGLIY